jgi:hypothetical protein
VKSGCAVVLIYDEIYLGFRVCEICRIGRTGCAPARHRGRCGQAEGGGGGGGGGRRGVMRMMMRNARCACDLDKNLQEVQNVDDVGGNFELLGALQA